MTRRRFSPLSLRTVIALLALVLGARLRAEENHAAAPKSEEKPEVVHPEPKTQAAEKPEVVEPTPAEDKPHSPAKTHADDKVEPAEHEAISTKPVPAHAPEPDAAPAEHQPSVPVAAVPSEHGEAGPAKKAVAAHGKPESAEPAAGTHGTTGHGATAHGEESHPAPGRPKSLFKEEAQNLLNLGAKLTDRGEYDAADVTFRQVFTNPSAQLVDVKSALLGLARMHRKQGALTKAVAIYERYLKDYPGDDRTPDCLLDLGRTLRALGVYKTAIARFYSVLNSTLKMPGEGFERYQVLAKTAQFEIAETYFTAGEYAEAAKFFTRLRLLDLAPSDRARAHFKAAYSLRLQGDLEGAVTMLRAFTDQWPDDENVPEARYLLATSLRELRRPQEASVATLELLRTEKSRVATDPKRWTYWQRRTGNQLANDFFESGNTLDAQAIYSGLLDLAPEPSWRLPITYQIALCYERLGSLDRARAAYQSIVEATAKNPPADLTELSRMAAWRIEHLAWRDGVAKQVSTFFDTSTGKTPATPASPAAAAPAASAPTSVTSPAPTSTAPATPPASTPAPAPSGSRAAITATTP